MREGYRFGQVAAPRRVVGRARRRALVEDGRIETQGLLECGHRVRSAPDAHEGIAEQHLRLGVVRAQPDRFAQLRLRFRGAVLHVEERRPEANAGLTVAGPPRHRAPVHLDHLVPPFERGEARGERGLDRGLAARGQAELEGLAAGRHRGLARRLRAETGLNDGRRHLGLGGRSRAERESQWEDGRSQKPSLLTMYGIFLGSPS